MQKFLTKTLKHKYTHKFKQALNLSVQMDECIDMMALETVSVGCSYEGKVLKEMVFYFLPEGHSTQEHIFDIVDEICKANHLLY